MPRPVLAPTDLVTIVRSATEALSVRCASAGVVVRFHAPPPVPVMGDGEQLERVFLNIVVNALDAMPRGGHLTVRMQDAVRPHPHADGARRAFRAVTIEDTGVGMPKEVLTRVREPFFTTKGRGLGSGLGLSVCDGIVREHGGFIEIESEPGRGTRVTVHLPAAPAPDLVTSEAAP
jgi:signal transduction histidine kinase